MTHLDLASTSDTSADRGSAVRTCAAALGSAGLLASGCGMLAGWFARWHWTFELATHFAVIWWIAAAVAVAAWLVARRLGWAALALVVLVYFSAQCLPLYLSTAQPPWSSSARVRVLLANVRTDNRQYQRLLNLVAETRPDVLVLQEVDPRWLAALAPLHEEFPHRIAEPRSDNFGIALFSRYPLAGQRTLFWPGVSVPFLAADILLPAAVPSEASLPDEQMPEPEAGVLHVLAVHAVPPVNRAAATARNAHLQAVGRYARSVPTPLAVVGDLNCTGWSPWFRDLLRQGDLRDSRQGWGIQPTWPRYRPPLRIPLDHLLHSPDVHTLSRHVAADIGSDHRPIVVDLMVKRERVPDPATAP